MEPKVAVVTGGSSGIGKAIVLKLAQEGYITIAISKSEEKLIKVQKQAQQKGINIEYYPLDISKSSQVEETINKIIEKHHQIDVLINNAGVGYKASVEEMTEEEFDDMMNTNIKGTFLMCKYVIPHMKKKQRGFILNIGSGAGLNGIPNLSGYCASKFALRGFTQAIAQELKPYNIKVSILNPGSTNTDLDFIKNLPKEKKESIIQPEDIADTVLHIISQVRRYWIFEVTARAFPSKKDKT